MPNIDFCPNFVPFDKLNIWKFLPTISSMEVAAWGRFLEFRPHILIKEPVNRNSNRQSSQV